MNILCFISKKIVIWFSTTNGLTVTETDQTITYQIAFKNPPYGWLGFFIAFSFPGLQDTVLQVTTETNVIPEYYPFADCSGENCFGTLV